MTDEIAELRRKLAQRDDEIATLQEVIRNMRRALEEEVDGLEFAQYLTRYERRLLAILMRRKRVTREQILTALYGDDPDGGANPKIIDVMVCRMRRKLDPFDIEIETIYGVGYQLSEASREILNPKPEPAKPPPARTTPCAAQISMFDGV